MTACLIQTLGFPKGSASKESAFNEETTGDAGLISGSGRDSLEKGMRILSRILSWKILWKEEPDGLQSKGLQRVGQYKYNYNPNTIKLHEGRNFLLFTE